MYQFCTKCGTRLENGICPNCSKTQTSPQVQQLQQLRQSVTNINHNDEKFKKIFMSPKEKFVCALGNNYVQNFLANGFLGKGFAVVSDKRVYFKGKAFELGAKKLRIKSVSSNVDLKDVTGTEVRHVNPVIIMIMAVIIFIMALVCFILSAAVETTIVIVGLFALAFGVFLTVAYIMERRTLLTIMFGGGGIAFDLKWYPAQEGENFQKMLRQAKDDAVEEAENVTANAMREVMSSVAAQPQQAASSADELAKYAQLFKDGMITEQEFADIKAKLLAKQ